MARDSDVRTDRTTAQHIAQALKLQSQYGFDYARAHLLSIGVEAQLAARLLSIRYERRAPVHGQPTRP